MSRQPIVVVESLERCAMDFVGHIDLLARYYEMRYIITASNSLMRAASGGEY